MISPVQSSRLLSVWRDVKTQETGQAWNPRPSGHVLKGRGVVGAFAGDMTADYALVGIDGINEATSFVESLFEDITESVKQIRKEENSTWRLRKELAPDIFPNWWRTKAPES